MVPNLPNLPVILGCLAVIIFLPLAISQIAYRITRRALEVTFCGFCIRRLPLEDIRYVSKHRWEQAEYWPNVLFPRKRVLVIRRRTGRRRDFVITPEQRYVFKANLEQAISDYRKEDVDYGKEDEETRDVRMIKKRMPRQSSRRRRSLMGSGQNPAPSPK